MREMIAKLFLAASIAVPGSVLAEEIEALDPAVDRAELEVDTDLPMGPILLGSFSLVAVAVGAGFGWQADQEYEDYVDARDDGRASDMKSLGEDVDDHSIAANVLMFAGAAGAVAALIWGLVDRPDSGEGQGGAGDSTAWRLDVGPGGAGISVDF